jgi:DUF4097 and DUF4098 domain-containing protein YvlB
MFGAFSGVAFSQKRFSRTYPATANVRLKLMNKSGTVTVEGWDRNQVQIIAALEEPAGTVSPQNLSGTIVVNMVQDNQGRADMGNANFLIRAPYSTMVDIETRIGNLNVTNISGGLVRARISTEGDITLTNIGASNVSAENVIGDIFYDGDIVPGGNYRFSSARGVVNLHIPFNASFRMVATAPSTRNISLGAFQGPNVNLVGDGRRVVGRFGDGSATLSVTNQQGSIFFSRR